MKINDINKELIINKLESFQMVSFEGFKNENEVDEFINKFPKYVRLKKRMSKRNNEYLHICVFEVTTLNRNTGTINEQANKRIKALLKGLGLC